MIARFRFLPLALGLAGGPLPVALAAPVFEEPFTNLTGKGRNIDVAAYEWASFLGLAGELNRAGTSIAANAGQPAEPAGYLTAANAPGQTRALVKNIKGGLDFAGATVSFRFGASHTQAEARLLIRVAGDWYASDTVFTSTATMANGAAFASAGEPAVLKKFPFSPAASAWRKFTLQPGVAAELSASRLAAPLPGTTVTAIGFLLSNPHSKWGVSAFLDTLQVTRPSGS